LGPKSERCTVVRHGPGEKTRAPRKNLDVLVCALDTLHLAAVAAPIDAGPRAAVDHPWDAPEVIDAQGYNQPKCALSPQVRIENRDAGRARPVRFELFEPRTVHGLVVLD